MMKKVTTLLFINILILNCLIAQSPAKYWVQFTDKEGSPYSIERPEEFLSPRAIENRKFFNIGINEADIPVNQHYITTIMSLDSGMMLFTKSKWLNGITVYSQIDSIQTMIEQLPFVKHCEKTITMKNPENHYSVPFYYAPKGAPKVIEPASNDELDYGKGAEQLKINNIHWLHRMGFKGEGMIMMVMDAGFQNADTIRHFRKIFEENRILGGRNFVLPENSIYRKDSHGTAVFSCIAANIPGELIGSAPHVMAYFAVTEDSRTENVVEEDNWVAGIEWADSLGCKVLNSSLGYTKFDDTLRKRSFKDLNGETSRASMAATIAASKGMIVCNSAGNSGEKSWKYIGSPADAKDILAVGAVNAQGEKASFTSLGPTADRRIKPDAVAVGEKTWVGNSLGKTVHANGSSFSSPLIAGMVACLWQAFPNKTNYEIMEAVRKSGALYSEPDKALGYGITDFMKAYNLLLQPDLNFPENIVFNSFSTTTKKDFFIQISNNRPVNVKITSTLRGSNTSTTQTHQIEKESSVKVKLPKLNKKQKYALIDVVIKSNDFERKFVIGLEH